MTNKLYDELMTLVNNNTFTPQALKAMNEALEKVGKLEDNLATANLRAKNLMEERDKINQALNAYINREGAIVSREEILAKREATHVELERKLAVAEAKESVRKEVFDTIFRNTGVRKRSTQDIPFVAPGTTYPSMHTQTNDIVEEEV